MSHKQLVQVCNFPNTAETVSYPDCNGNTVNQDVSQVVGAYILNQKNEFLDEVYDVQTVTLGGSVTPVITAPSTLSITFGSVTVTPAGSDTVLGYLTDFGTGATDIGNTPSFNFAGQPAITPPARYEVKSYAIMASGNIILISGQEYNRDGTTLTSAGSSTVVNRTYQVERGVAKQRVCKQGTTITVSDPFTGNNTPYIVLGVLSDKQPVVRDERFSNADITMAGVSTTIVPVTTENASPNRITGAIANLATIVTNPTFTGARDVTVYNQYNVTIAFEYTTTNNATFHRVNVPRGATRSNTLKRDDYTNEGTYTAGRVVFAFGAGAIGPVAAPSEVNIDWTT